MELYTLDSEFNWNEVIDEFKSVIWTERYYGDSNIELIVPKNTETREKLRVGTFVGLKGSNEIMILETHDLNEPQLKITGISLTQWLNNRFIRNSEIQKDRSWLFEYYHPGEILWTLVYEMCTQDSSYLNSPYLPMGVPVGYRERLIIPELGLHSYDQTDERTSIAVPFGPLYDGLREVAIPYGLGIQVVKHTDPDADRPLGFRVYKGLNRTSLQDLNPLVRFSPFWDSLTDVKELQSIAIYKNLAFGFSSEAAKIVTTPGVAFAAGTEDLNGFDCRALEVVVEDIAEKDTDVIVSFLNQRAKEALSNNPWVISVDGEIVPTHQFKYEKDFFLGDLVEIQGNSGEIQVARVTEYIRTQSSIGEKSYPTVTVVRDLAPHYIRYVDFDNGNDDNDGMTKENAWKSIHGNNTNRWTDSGEDPEKYFHGHQIGPGYEYRMRGTYEAVEEINGMQILNTSDGFPKITGSPGAPIVFTSWDLVNDRAIIKSTSTWGIETASEGILDEPGLSPVEDHYLLFRGIDFRINDSVLYGNYTSFINCTFIPPDPTDNPRCQLLIYGDHVLLDGCTFRASEENPILLYGVYIIIQNCVIHGFNRNGGEIDRDSDDDYVRNGFEWPWLIYQQHSLPPFNQTDALRIVNNTIVGWGGVDSEINGLGLIYGEYPVNHHVGVVIRNNIFADIGSVPTGVPEDDYRGFWYIDPNLAPIHIDNNLFANDIVNIPSESYHKNVYDVSNPDSQVITFKRSSDIFSDPKFISQSERNFKLKSTSPAINAGDPNNTPEYDILGVRRKGLPDMGAYEYGAP